LPEQQNAALSLGGRVPLGMQHRLPEHTVDGSPVQHPAAVVHEFATLKLGLQQLPPVHTPLQQLAPVVQGGAGVPSARQVQVPPAQMPLQHSDPAVHGPVLVGTHATQTPPRHKPVQHWPSAVHESVVIRHVVHVPSEQMPLQHCVLVEHEAAAGRQQRPAEHTPSQHWLPAVHATPVALHWQVPLVHVPEQQSAPNRQGPAVTWHWHVPDEQFCVQHWLLVAQGLPLGTQGPPVACAAAGVGARMVVMVGNTNTASPALRSRSRRLIPSSGKRTGVASSPASVSSRSAPHTTASGVASPNRPRTSSATWSTVATPSHAAHTAAAIGCSKWALSAAPS
jgi:hypothetical protein